MLRQFVEIAARSAEAAHDLGRAVLLGLEILVAADIISAVALTQTLQSFIVLGIIVLIRTFLSWSLALELDGRWPWQRERTKAGVFPQSLSSSWISAAVLSQRRPPRASRCA
jgi:hypothetical protein